MTFDIVCVIMGGSRTRRGLAMSLLLLFVISTQSYYFYNQETILDDNVEDITKLVLGPGGKNSNRFLPLRRG